MKITIFQSVRLCLAVQVILFAVSACISASGLAAENATEENFVGYEKSIKPFIQQHCIRCHGPKTTEGDMRLDQLSAIISDEHVAESWQEVLDVLNAGEMPPEEETQPDKGQLASVIGVLTDRLHEARKRLVDKRNITIRRLNRREYANTIRALLGVPVDVTALPADGTLDGFDTIGDAHFMSTVQFEKYLELGRIALDRALVAGNRPQRGVSRIEP